MFITWSVLRVNNVITGEVLDDLLEQRYAILECFEI